VLYPLCDDRTVVAGSVHSVDERAGIWYDLRINTIKVLIVVDPSVDNLLLGHVLQIERHIEAHVHG